MILRVIIIMCVGIGITTNSAFSQKSTMKATEEICTCFNTIKTDSAAAKVTDSATPCLVTGINNNLEGLVKENNIKELNEQSGQKLGEVIAKNLLDDCPTATNIFTIIGEEQVEEVEKEQQEEK